LHGGTAQLHHRLTNLLRSHRLGFHTLVDKLKSRIQVLHLLVLVFGATLPIVSTGERRYTCYKKRWGIVQLPLRKCIFMPDRLIVVGCICLMMMSDGVRGERAEGTFSLGIQTPTNCKHRIDGGVLYPSSVRSQAEGGGSIPFCQLSLQHSCLS
jgi:hypothetical protein